MNSPILLRCLNSFQRIAPSVVAACVVAAFTTVDATAKGGPNVNLDEPVLVEVQGPVEVQGSVEIVNDALKVPFAHREIVTMTAVTGSVLQQIALPPGKRLVIETVTLRGAVPLGQEILALLHLPNNVVADLAFQSRVTLGDTSRFVGTHAVTFRVNTTETPSIGIEFGRTMVANTASFSVSLFGYMEDL